MALFDYVNQTSIFLKKAGLGDNVFLHLSRVVDPKTLNSAVLGDWEFGGRVQLEPLVRNTARTIQNNMPPVPLSGADANSTPKNSHFEPRSPASTRRANSGFGSIVELVLEATSVYMVISWQRMGNR